jgi:hypothetical protein
MLESVRPAGCSGQSGQRLVTSNVNVSARRPPLTHPRQRLAFRLDIGRIRGFEYAAIYRGAERVAGDLCSQPGMNIVHPSLKADRPDRRHPEYLCRLLIKAATFAGATARITERSSCKIIHKHEGLPGRNKGRQLP